MTKKHFLFGLFVSLFVILTDVKPYSIGRSIVPLYENPVGFVKSVQSLVDLNAKATADVDQALDLAKGYVDREFDVTSYNRDYSYEIPYDQSSHFINGLGSSHYLSTGEKLKGINDSLDSQAKTALDSSAYSNTSFRNLRYVMTKGEDSVDDSRLYPAQSSFRVARSDFDSLKRKANGPSYATSVAPDYSGNPLLTLPSGWADNHGLFGVPIA